MLKAATLVEQSLYDTTRTAASAPRSPSLMGALQAPGATVASPSLKMMNRRYLLLPVRSQLGYRFSHVLRRMLPIAMYLLQKEGAFLTGHDLFLKRVGAAYHAFLEDAEVGRRNLMPNLMITGQGVSNKMARSRGPAHVHSVTLLLKLLPLFFCRLACDYMPPFSHCTGHVHYRAGL